MLNVKTPINVTKTKQIIHYSRHTQVFVSFSTKSLNVNKENMHMPDYPPSDEDSPIKGDKNVARMGAATDSPGGWSFIKSVGSYLSSSFYW